MRQELDTLQNVFHGPQFQSTRGTTEVEPTLHTLFNVAVDSVVRYRISLTVEDDSTTNDRLGMAVGRCMVVFCADGGMIRSRDQECIQGAINVLIRLFRRVGLTNNVEKPNTIDSQSGLI